MYYSVEHIARVCHETNGSFCNSIGDHSQPSWDEAPEWQRQSGIQGVEFALANPKAPASAQHEAWCADKVANGWKFGPAKDTEKKEHHCLIPYADLPIEQRTKDYLFRAVILAMTASRD